MDDEARRLLRHQDSDRGVVAVRIITGVMEIFDVVGVVAATHAARPDGGSHTHTGIRICIHRVAMMSPMRGQSGRSRESEDSKTDKNAFGL